MYITMHQAGFENVVASSGTSLTQDQLFQLLRLTKNLVFIYDSDSAGQKATSRGLSMALEKGFNVYIVSLPIGEDPDSIIRKKR